MTLALPGSVYLYQGEELGLPEVLDLPDEARQDPIFARSGGAETGPGRLAGCRCPWVHDAPSFGFSSGDGHGGSGGDSAGDGHAGGRGSRSRTGSPRYAVDTERADPESTYNLTRRALALRGALWSEPDEPLRWLATPGRDDVLAFARGDAVCACVCGARPVRAAAGVGRGRAGQRAARPAGGCPATRPAWLRRGAPAGD